MRAISEAEKGRVLYPAVDLLLPVILFQFIYREI